MDSAQLVSHVLQAKTALSSIGSSPLGSDPNSVKGEDTDRLVTGVQNSWMYILAAGGMLSGVASMALTVDIMVDIASISCLCLAPYAVYQKSQLKALGGMRFQQNTLRESINTFHEENQKLEQNVTNLQKSVDALKEVEKGWEAVVKTSGGNADRLVEIVQQNKALQQKIKANLERNIMQDILEAVLVSDLNEDFSLNLKELKRLETRFANLPAVTFDKANWTKFVAGKEVIDLATVMSVLRNLTDDIPDEDNIFHLHPEKL